MNNQAIGLHSDELKAMVEIFRKNPKIEEVILFGSRAKGSFSTGSDIDLALKGEVLSLNDVLDTSIALDQLELPYSFDLVIFNRITDKSLLEHIQRVGISLFAQSPEN